MTIDTDNMIEVKLNEGDDFLKVRELNTNWS